MNDTKEFIIDQAFKLFLNHSYEAVSISDISKSVGMTKGALYHHFLNKEELFKTVIDKYLRIETLGHEMEFETMRQYIDASIENTRRIIYNTFGDRPNFLPLNYLSLLIDALRHYPGYELGNERLFSGEIEKIRKVIAHAVEKSELRKDLDIEVAAVNFFSINLGLAANLYAYRSPSLAISTLKKQLYEYYKLLKA